MSPVTRVFICDDNAELRELTRLGLEEDPELQVVGEAPDAPAALAALPSCEPDVVLLDLSMPGMDGLEALPCIKDLAPSVKIVVFSGFSATRLAEKSLEMGADEYLEKGAPIETVRESVRVWQ